MKLPRLEALIGFLLAAVFTATGWCADTAVPGTLNYIEGQASLAGQTLNPKSVGSVDLQPGQTLTTGAGKAEILLTPGVFLRLGDNSTIKMVSASLTNTEADLVKGQATVEVAELHTYNLLRIGQDGANTELLRDSLYAFDADNDRVRVLKGEARVEDNDQTVVVKSGHELDLNSGGKLKSAKFDKNAYEATDLYRFSDLRSEYLAEANVDVGRQYYAGGAGWYGPGWYWDPWFWSYTWLPGNGIFYSPFGWGFYSPWMVGYAPYYGLRGYGYYGRYYAGRNYPAPAARASEGHGFAAVRGGRPYGLAGPGFRGGSFAGGFPAAGGGGTRH